MTNDQPFRFLLNGITTDQFAALEPDGFNGESEGVAWKLNYHAILGECILTVSPLLTFKFGEQATLVLEITCSFQILAEDWPRLFSEEKQQVTIPLSLARHLSVIAVGVARGVLHAKVEDHPRHRLFMLPIVDLTQAITEEVVFDIGPK